MSVGVFDPMGLLRAATAELAPSTHTSTEGVDRVHVVPGARGWPDAVVSAGDGGARAVVVVEPAPATADEHDRIAGIAVPVIVSRARLRADVAADAAPIDPVPLLVVDAVAPREDARATVRDAIGWVRELTGGAPQRISVSRTGRALVAELATGGTVAAITLAIAGAGNEPWLDLVAMAATRVHVRVAPDLMAREVVHVGAEGRVVKPYRFEAGERLALRRALACLRSGGSDDRVALRSDDLLAAELCDGAWP